MNSALQYIKNKYNLDYNIESPITLAPFHRYHQLVDLFRELEFIKGAEIGTARAVYAEILCKGIPDLKLYCVDPWLAYDEYDERWAQEQIEMDRIFEEAKNKLSNYNCEIIKKTSMEASKDFKPNSLDFVFIDGNHDFEYVVNDIIAWMKIVKPGGIISGHDFTTDVVKGTHFQIPYAVRAYAQAYDIHPWFVLHHSGTVDCWMWVKPDKT